MDSQDGQDFELGLSRSTPRIPREEPQKAQKTQKNRDAEMLRGRGTADERRYFLKGWRKRDQTQNINLGFLSFHWLSAGKVEDLSNRVSLESIFIAFNNFKPSNRLARS